MKLKPYNNLSLYTRKQEAMLQVVATISYQLNFDPGHD
jgi:hypothetical protein